PGPDSRELQSEEVHEKKLNEGRRCELSSMDQCEDREDRVPPSKTTLCGEHEDQSKVQ
ncbi:hypothetical protein AMECASPLE_038521, partial [Ameca splendens]